MKRYSYAGLREIDMNDYLEYDDPYAGVIDYEYLLLMQDEELLLLGAEEYPTEEEYTNDGAA
jgi:hypothetical protein